MTSPDGHDLPPSSDRPAVAYDTPRALLDAIAARVRNAVEAGSPYTASQLRRQFAYDRLLARVFLAEPDRWVLKGAGNLLARIPHARYSLDLDLLYTGELNAAVDALREAAGRDLGDHFRFDIGSARGTLIGVRGLTLPVVSRVGPRLFEPFSVDLVVELTMTGQPETVGPLHPIRLDGLITTAYRGYPIADQIADKHCAIIERHGPHGDLPSTRYRDLVDLVLIATTQSIDAVPLHTALHSEYARRDLEPPNQFRIPDAGGWQAGYQRAARDAPGLVVTMLEEATAIVASLIDPILSGRRSGRWQPDRREWSDD